MNKSYEEKVRDIKNEILGEIRKEICGKEGYDSRFAFDDPFFIHYVGGEVATTDVCHAVEICSNGYVVFSVSKDRETPRDKEEVIEADMIYNYTVDSFIDILDNLKKEKREEKLAKLRRIVQRNGGEILFDGDFKFDGWDQGMFCENNSLYGISLNPKGKLVFDTSFEGNEYTNNESYPDNDEIDRIIAYAESESFSLTSEQDEAVNEFIAAAKKLDQMNVTVIRDNINDELYFINGKRIEELFADYDGVSGGKDITEVVMKSKSILSFVDAAFYSPDGERIIVKMTD